MWKRGTKKRWRRVCAKPNFISSKNFNKDLEDVNLRKSNVVLYRLGIAFFFLFLTWLSCPGSRLTTTLLNLQTEKRPLFVYKHELPLLWYPKKIFIKICFIKLFLTPVFFLIHFLFSITSAKVLGKIKDDCRGKPVEEFIGLRSMLNSFFNDDMEKTVKGVKHICNWQTLKTTGL